MVKPVRVKWTKGKKPTIGNIAKYLDRTVKLVIEHEGYDVSAIKKQLELRDEEYKRSKEEFDKLTKQLRDLITRQNAIRQKIEKENRPPEPSEVDEINRMEVKGKATAALIVHTFRDMVKSLHAKNLLERALKESDPAVRAELVASASASMSAPVSVKAPKVISGETVSAEVPPLVELIKNKKLAQDIASGVVESVKVEGYFGCRCGFSDFGQEQKSSGWGEIITGITNLGSAIANAVGLVKSAQEQRKAAAEQTKTAALNLEAAKESTKQAALQLAGLQAQLQAATIMATKPTPKWVWGVIGLGAFGIGGFLLYKMTRK